MNRRLSDRARRESKLNTTSTKHLRFEINYSYVDDDGQTGHDTKIIGVHPIESRDGIPLCDFFSEIGRTKK